VDFEKGSIKAPKPIHDEMRVGKIPSVAGNTKWRITNLCVYKCAPFANGFSIFCRPRIRHNQHSRNEPHGHGTIETVRQSVNGMETWLRGETRLHGMIRSGWHGVRPEFA